MKKEIEAKFLAVDKDLMRAKFKQAGFTLETPEYLMSRKAFDISSDGTGHRWGRVRRESGKVTMAIKQNSGTGINDVFEVELVVNDFDSAVQFMEAAGLKLRALQENLREVWTREGVEATIDTWPGLNPFVEIEGSNEEVVRKASKELGFDFGQAVFGGVARAYAKELGLPEKIINALPEITFANPPKREAAPKPE